MYHLADFSRRVGSKDKQKRKRKRISKGTRVALGVIGAGLLGASYLLERRLRGKQGEALGQAIKERFSNASKTHVDHIDDKFQQVSSNLHNKLELNKAAVEAQNKLLTPPTKRELRKSIAAQGVELGNRDVLGVGQLIEGRKRELQSKKEDINSYRKAVQKARDNSLSRKERRQAGREARYHLSTIKNGYGTYQHYIRQHFKDKGAFHHSYYHLAKFSTIQ